MSPKLLVADDSITIRRVIELTFADEGVEVIAVSDGRQAIERIERERPDVVLADVSMPERTGYEVAWFVKNNPHLSHVPVLLLTGAFDPIDRERAEEVGCRGVLAKPFEPDVVVRRVRDLLAAPAQPEADAADVGYVPSGGNTDTYAPPEEHAAGKGSETFPEQTDSESLNEFFDRLDLHFGVRVAPGESPAAQPKESSQVAVQPPSVRGDTEALPEPERSAVPVGGPRRAHGASGRSLADSFRSLLAAEEGRHTVDEPYDVTPPHAFDRAATGPDLSAPFISSEEMDRIVERAARRVIETFAENFSRESVINLVREVAERIVRDEIERQKLGTP